MKAISLWQPHASLVVAGVKRFETRSWATSYRGRLAIHAAKLTGFNLWKRLGADDAATAEMNRLETILLRADGGYIFVSCGCGRIDIDTLPRGCLLGTVELVDVFHCRPLWNGGVVDTTLLIDPENTARGAGLSALERSLGDYSPGRYAWAFENPVAFPRPIPYRGRQRLFDVPDELLGVAP